MLLRSTLTASAALVLLVAISPSPVEAHSWADCVDWRFNIPGKQDWTETGGKCFGYARKFPVNSGIAFGGLDSNSPNRHYQQNPADFTPCSDGVHGREPGSDETRQDPISKSYGGQYGNMASVRAGDSICVRWPAKNHAVPSEKDRGVFINMPSTPVDKDPTQTQFMNMTIAKLPYKNCTFLSDTDRTPCGGCFTVPAGSVPGNYVVQWRWELNDNEWYTSCWDLAVTSTTPQTPGSNDTVPPPPRVLNPVSGSTSLFAELAED